MFGIPNIVVNYPMSSNRTSLRLLEEGIPADLTEVTEMAIVFPNGYTMSSKTDPGIFQWIGTKATGVVNLFIGRLGQQSPFSECGSYECQFVVYDDLNWRGALWGYIRLMVV